MTSLTHDSELIIQHVAALAVPSSSKFFTVIDEAGNPMVFSLGTDLKLHVIKSNMAREHKLVDFGALLRLGTSYKASAFSVVQSEDLSIYVAFQTEASEGQPTSRLVLLKPFKPNSFNLDSWDTDLSGLIMPQVGEIADKLVKSIFMSNSNRRQHYPLIICAYQPLGHIRFTEDIARLQVNAGLDGWSLQTDLSLPENASKIYDLQPLNIPFGDESLAGFATLYAVQEELQLIFMSTDKIEDEFYQVSLSCPPGVKTLSSLIDSEGFTGLLVAGNGLYHFESTQCLKKNAQGKNICDQGVFGSVEHLHVAQSKTGLTVWAANSQDGIGYLMADTKLTTVEAPIQVIPNAFGGWFSAFRANSTSPEQLIFSNNDGVLGLIQHDGVLGLWNPSPFFTPALEKIVDIPSYTTQITLRGPDRMPLVFSEVYIEFLGSISIIANGRFMVAGPVAVPVETDQHGLITLIIPTNDISSPTFTVTDAQGKVFRVDPTEKVNSVLSGIQSADDLTGAILPSGEGLLEGTSLTNQEIDTVARAIKAAQEARKNITKEGVSRSEGLGAAASHPLHPPREETLIGFNTSVFLVRRSIIEMLWDSWHWLENLATKIVSWAIQRLQDGAAFIVSVGETTYRWVLRGVTEVGKAISWIFNKVLELGDKVVQWLGFIFDWEDIKATHRSIIHLANNALSTGLNSIGGLETQVDTFFDDLRTKLQADSSQSRPPKVNNATVDGNLTELVSQDPARSMKANWTQYQFFHGGASRGSIVHGASDRVESPQGLWTETIQPLYKDLETEVRKLVETITELFKNFASLSVSEAMSHLNITILLEFVDAIRKLATGILRVTRTVIAEFKTYINYKITVPIFSNLYKRFISDGRDLTLLEAVAIILAIPVTIVTKVITGEKPPDMTDFDFAQSGRARAKASNQNLDLRYNRFSSVGGIIINPITGTLATISMLEANAMSRSSGQDLRSPAFSMMHQTDMLHHATALSPKATSLAELHWGDICSFFSCVFSFPSDPDQPAPVLSWISWILGCVNVITSVALQQLGVASSLAGEKALAIIQAALATINYALIVAIKTIEFQTSNGDGVADSSSILSLISGTFSLLGTLSTDFGALAVDPDTKGWAAVASLSTQALSYTVDVSLALFNLPRGVYNPINTRVM